jgi:carbon-monoxide dehydrogenase medium subunit
MKPARFSYEAPPTLAAALGILAERGDEAKVIAGGQSLAPMLNMRLARPGLLVDINGLAELAEIKGDGEHLVVGALVRHADLACHPLVLAHSPALACAARTIGHYAIRQRGTIGGSLAHADPAAQLPLMAVALDAEIEAVSLRGTRLIPAQEFFLSIFSTALERDELITAIRFPVRRPHEGWSFRLFRRRAGDFALAAVAATLVVSAEAVLEAARCAVSGIGRVPVRAEAVGGLTAGMRLRAGWSREVAQVMAAALEIEDNERVPVEYRRELVAALVEDALEEAQERAG